MRGLFVDRCVTGITGFDKISQGGFVRNSSNLIAGGPGSGKTTFLLQFLWNGAVQFNENGLYCSFEPDIIETLKDGMSYGWDFSKLNEQDKVKFLKFSPKTSVDDLKSELTKLIAKYNIKRICFDPISVLTLSNNEGKIRETLFDLVSLIKRLNVTSILTDELMESQNNEITNVTEVMNFLTDSLIVFYESNPNQNTPADRALRIIKMRRTEHTRIPVGMKIGENGIEVMA